MLAFMLARSSTLKGLRMAENPDTPSDHAAALSKLGASKGGAARAARLTPDERRDIAKHAAEARWGQSIRYAPYSGVLEIGDMSIACAVLEDGTRVLSQATVLRALGRNPEKSRRARARQHRASRAVPIGQQPPAVHHGRTAGAGRADPVPGRRRQAGQPVLGLQGRDAATSLRGLPSSCRAEEAGFPRSARGRQGGRHPRCGGLPASASRRL